MIKEERHERITRMITLAIEKLGPIDISDPLDERMVNQRDIQFAEAVQSIIANMLKLSKTVDSGKLCLRHAMQDDRIPPMLEAEALLEQVTMLLERAGLSEVRV